ncbi:hypothetical protein [Xanthomonas sp. 3075]|uniref:hypothetical protein n=1 Tax=Xanthomonas sp. 3075 TaxID=3035315 RepID=UPI0016205DE9|nr:hypothetical protein [Xanthomonas sp. 3075]MBB4130558.1 hypothetical protein [Xanthomonas sp. 3075]
MVLPVQQWADRLLKHPAMQRRQRPAPLPTVADLTGIGPNIATASQRACMLPHVVCDEVANQRPFVSTGALMR